VENEKRMAGEYEIIHAVQIGDREIVVGENPADANGQKYMTAFCEANELFARYDEVLVSDDYPEIMKYFGERIAQQAEKTRAEMFTPKFQGIDVSPIMGEGCTPITGKDDLNGKVIVIRPEVLRREYRRATNQVKLCTGGFGASPNSRGSACFCKDVYSGKESRYERRDVLGVLTPEQRPEWVKYGLESIKQAEGQKEKTNKERER
jgi:hypothetical protein